MKTTFFTIAIICFLFSLNLKAQDATPTPVSKAKINFKALEHDFGKINENDGPVTFKFDLTNDGTDPLTLSNVKASCGCTTPDWTKEPIAPKGKGNVQATYNPKNRPGKFTKTITVSNNSDQPSVVLTIKGEVIPAPVELPANPEPQK